MIKHTPICSALVGVFTAAILTFASVQQAAAQDQKGISATACQPFLPTTYNEALFKDNAIYNATNANQRVICPLNKDALTNWNGGTAATLTAYVKAGSKPGGVACTVYGGGAAFNGSSQVAYAGGVGGVPAGGNDSFFIGDITDPPGGVTIEGWNVLCTLNAGMSLGGFFFVENSDTDGGY